MWFRLFIAMSPIVIFALAAMPVLGDELPTLVKVRLKGGRSVVGEFIEQSGDGIKLLDLKSGKHADYAQNDLLKVERNVADSDAIAAVGLPAFVAWKLSCNQANATGKIADIKPTAIYVTIGTKTNIRNGQKLFVYRDEGEIKDPDTGEVLERQRAKIAELQVTDAREKFSKAKLLGDLEVQLRVGDQVETDSAGRVIAILPPIDETNHRRVAGERIAEELATALVGRGMRVVERTLLGQVLDELDLQGLFEDATLTRKVGKQLGANAVMTARLVESGRFLSVNVRLIDVESGEILLAASQKTSGDAGEVLIEEGGSDNNANKSSAGAGAKAPTSGDLLSRVDISVHAHSNNVKQSGKSVVVGPQSVLSLPPFEASGNYELEIEFVRASGSDSLVGMLPIGKGHFNFGISQDFGLRHTLMSAAHQPGKLQNDRRYALRFRVKAKGDKGSVEMIFDGNSIIKTEINIAPVDHEWAGIQPGWIPAIKSQNATYEIQSITVKRL